MNNEELIWVDKDFADKWKELKSKKTTRDQQEEVFNTYCSSVKNQIKSEFQSNLESLEEDAAMFTGLMIKVKQTFEKTKNEQMDASYALWEKFEAEIPSTNKKVASIIAVLVPLEKQLRTINDLLSKINTYDIDRFSNSLAGLAAHTGRSKEMLDFVVKNFPSQGVK